MTEKILKFADEFDMLPETGLVLACVSGGADSMCLLEALLDISRKRGFEVGALHFNHGLRGGESDRDEAFVRENCAMRGVMLRSRRGDVRAYAKKTGLGIEAAAREMRYVFFHEAAAEAAAEGGIAERPVRIATAHTADDNAETIIMNLARGAGTSGLSGIPPVRGIIVRPMLTVSRTEVTRFLSSRGVAFVEDSTNSLEIYTRNKLRHTVIPALREINPGFSEAAASAAELLREDEEYLSGLASAFIKEYCIYRRNPVTAGAETLTPEVGGDDLMKLPPAVAGRVIRKLHGGSLSHKHVKAVLEFCGRAGPPARLSLPGATVYREYGRIVFSREPSRADGAGFAQIWLTDGDRIAIPETGLEVSCASVECGGPDRDDSDGRINKSFTSFLFKTSEIYGRMTVRPRLEGDSIRLLGHNGTKTLKKLFIERKVPARERSRVPVIADDAGVLAVYGLGTGSRAVPEPGDTALRIVFIEKDGHI